MTAQDSGLTTRQYKVVVNIGASYQHDSTRLWSPSNQQHPPKKDLLSRKKVQVTRFELSTGGCGMAASRRWACCYFWAIPTVGFQEQPHVHVVQVSQSRAFLVFVLQI